MSLPAVADPQTGLPALSLPVGFLPSDDEHKAQLPVGMQLVGKWYAEPTLYRAAYAWEQAYDWKAQKDSTQ